MMEVKITRSLRRTRTVSARVVNDIILVRAPVFISETHLQRIVEGFKARFEGNKRKNELNATGDLLQRAARINKRYFNNTLTINSIEYVTDQQSKFGCCNYVTASIRISHKVSTMPDWVREYVVLHEIAHLVVPNHSRSFWNIVSRYKLTERAKGYLIARGLETSTE